MSERLTLQDLTDLLADKQGITKKDAENFLRELVSVISDTIEKNESVKIKDFGTFKLVKVNSRKSVDVNTGEAIEIPAHYKLSFAPDKSLRDSINTPFAHFESTLMEDGVSFGEVKEELEESDVEDIDVDIDDDSLNETITNNKKMKEENEEQIREEIVEQERSEKIASPSEDEYEYDSEDDEVEYESNNKTRIAIIALVAVLLLLGGFYFYRSRSGASSAKELAQKEAAVADSIARASADSLSTALTEEAAMKASADAAVREAEEQAKSKNYKPKARVTVQKGQTLRKLALKHYGDKTFWVYIYQENQAKINDFNTISIGLKLTIPAAEKYGIKASDSQSLAKAKVLEDRYFK